MEQIFKPYLRDYIFPGRNEEKAALNDGTMVTVICVTYAHENYISQTLDSIVSQKTTFRFKVFVGEDCGPDRTADIVLQYAEKYPDIVIPFIRNKNMGPKKNLVDLIDHATSPYVCFCDGDDYWIDENKLQKQYDYMEKNPEVRGCFARAKIEAPDSWYLNDYFKPDRDGNRIMPDCLPGFHIPKRLLNARDIIQFHPMHTVTVFYRWNYDVGFPEWFFYGVLGDIPMSLLQIGDGQVAFLPDLVGVYRRSDAGVHMFSNKDEHFLQTRGDYFNYLQGIYDDFSYRFGNFAKKVLENRMKQEWNNLIRAALNSGRMDILAQLVAEFPASASIALSNYCISYEKGRRMLSNYGQHGYDFLMQNRIFIYLFAPIIKEASNFYSNFKKLLRMNWLKKVLKLPYILLFDRQLPKDIREAYEMNSMSLTMEMPYQHSWGDFFSEVKNKKIVFCGFGPGVWNFIDSYQDRYEYLCIIGFGEERSIYKGIPIIAYNEFITLMPQLEDNIVYLLSDCHPSRLAALLQYMEEIGVSDYYSYCFMEGSRPDYLRLLPAYKLKNYVRELVHPNGFFKNEIGFNLKRWMRRHKISPDWKTYAKLQQFKGIHEGETCYIVGTGPSLTLNDIDLLKDKTTFSVNGIFRLFSQTEWRPTYYAICDPNACTETLKYLQKSEKNIKADDIKWDSFCTQAFFIPNSVKPWIENNPNTHKGFMVAYSYLNQHINPYHNFFKYSADIVEGSYNMRTVVNFCINIAHYMGFKKIVFVGVDCDYTGYVQYFDGSVNIHASGKNKPYKAFLTQRGMIKAYQYIKAIAQQEGIQIYNATRGGHLEVFDRIELEDVVNQ